MTSASFELSRRQALAGLGGVSALALTGCKTMAPASSLDPQALLDDIAWNLLRHQPEGATSLGLDTGEHAALRGKLADRSSAGQAALAATLRSDLARARAVDTSALDPATRTSFEVVESAYATALDGFALPYGDVAVGGWRNTPYVVIQNVGGYLDYPRFLDSDQPMRDASDVRACLARLEQIPRVLSWEFERLRAATGIGLVPPAFPLTRAITQMEASLADARNGGSLVESITRRATEAHVAGDWAAQSRNCLSPARSWRRSASRETKSMRPTGWACGT
jgi:uncharacterized protein (DUF885 family)